MLHFIRVLVCFVVVSQIPNAAQVPQSSLADDIEAVRSSVARVDVRFSDHSGGSGTGVFVNDDGYLVTAAHVVTAPSGKTVADVEVVTRIPPTNQGGVIVTGSFSGSTAKVIVVDLVHDLAILLPSQNPFKDRRTGLVAGGSDVQRSAVSFAKIDPRKLRDGEPVFVSGYPLSNNTLVTTSGNIASTRDYPVQSPRSLAFGYIADIHVNPGNSGGPVFSKEGRRVIGICLAARGEKHHFHAAIDPLLTIRWQAIQ